MRTLTADDLWRIPRVGAPVPSSFGTRVIVPVTTYSGEKEEGTTRLFLVATGSEGPVPRALTTADASSGQPAFSPDGTTVAFVRKPGGEKGKGGPEHPDVPQLYMLPVDGGEAERLTDLPLGVASPEWFPDGRKIAFLSEVYRGAVTPPEVAAKKKEIEESRDSARATEDRLYRYWDRWLTDGRHRHIFVLDLDSRELCDLTPASFRHIGISDPSNCFRISPDGTEICFDGCRNDPPYDEFVQAVYTIKVPARIRAGARVAKPKLLAPKHTENSLRGTYSRDGRWVVYGVQRKRGFYADRIRLVAFDRASGEHVVLLEDWDLSPSGWTFDRIGNLWFTAEVDAKSAIFCFDFRDAVRTPGTVYPDEVARGGTYSAPRPAGGRIFASRESLCEPPEVFLIVPDGAPVRRITRFTRESLKGIRLGRVRDETFTGAQGDEVQMYVLFPPGVRPREKGGKPLPLVHMIHGGPHGVFGDQWHWRWNAQVFAEPGHLVAMVNFHGSTSFGQDFAECIQGRWGDQPTDDILAATDLLVERGLADPKRMAITGGSYGGYLVSWIASRTDRFACIVNHAGVSDFQTQYASDVVHHRAAAMGGEPWDDLEGLDRYNPMRHAAGFKSPMLVIHGEKDYRVPCDQGLEIYAVLKAMGVPARLLVYPDENHWILKPSNSKRWYREVLGWLGRWLET